MAERHERCDQCRWWEGHANVKYDEGSCHRHAPRGRERDAAGEDIRPWPITLNDDWCGEFDAESVNELDELIDGIKGA